ncbi:MAG: amino acid racemase [Lachnospiraceae bacterium]|nr:amino acid racemase [Lachnospiraceae bacterium]
MKKLGVVGGLGPMATAYFMQLVTQMTEAETDQQHIEMLIHSCPAIPDRTQFILGKSKEDPSDPIIEIGKELKGLGAELLAIPCITAHYFHDKLEQRIGLPIIHIVKETGKYLQQRKISCAGIMATDGTIESALFQKELEQLGIHTVIPDEVHQQMVMDIIYKNVKAGKPVDMELFAGAADNLQQQGAEVIVLGCTELSMAKRDQTIGAGFLDAMEILAKCSVEACGVLKPEYRELITQ